MFSAIVAIVSERPSSTISTPPLYKPDQLTFFLIVTLKPSINCFFVAADTTICVFFIAPKVTLSDSVSAAPVAKALNNIDVYDLSIPYIPSVPSASLS